MAADPVLQQCAQLIHVDVATRVERLAGVAGEIAATEVVAEGGRVKPHGFRRLLERDEG